LKEQKESEVKRRLAEKKLQEEEERHIHNIENEARSQSRLPILKRSIKSTNDSLTVEAESLLRPASLLVDPLDVHAPLGTPTQIDLNPVDIQLNDAKRDIQMFDEAKYQNTRAPFGQVQDQYTYMPLKPGYIRLLRFVQMKKRWASQAIVIRILEAPLHAAPKYEAFSYRWDNYGIPSYIVCEGSKVAISSNCKAALEQFQIPNRLLWVDSVCIYPYRSRIKHIGNLRCLFPHRALRSFIQAYLIGQYSQCISPHFTAWSQMKQQVTSSQSRFRNLKYSINYLVQSLSSYEHYPLTLSLS
jgi:hypothetical protein